MPTSYHECYFLKRTNKNHNVIWCRKNKRKNKNLTMQWLKTNEKVKYNFRLHNITFYTTTLFVRCIQIHSPKNKRNEVHKCKPNWGVYMSPIRRYIIYYFPKSKFVFYVMFIFKKCTIVFHTMSLLS